MTVKKHKIVLLGDSILANYPMSNIPQPHCNLAVAGSRIPHLISRTLEVVRENPSHVILMVGINDLLLEHGVFGAPFVIDFTFAYRLLIDLLKRNLPDLSIITMDILPVGAALTDAVLLNSRIITLNNFLTQNASINGHTHHACYHTLISPENNCLNPILTTDGIHLNAAGYALLSQSLNQVLPQSGIET